MKKIIFTLTVLCVLSLTSQPVFSSTFTHHSLSGNADNGGKKQAISIGSNRASGNMQLRFTSGKAGEASITILNESGKIVLQQTNQVTNSINTIPLTNATELPEGNYTIRLISNNETMTTRFMIWK